MDLWFSRLRHWFFGTEYVRVMMFGLDNAGKTAILFRLKRGKMIDTFPTTCGCNVECIPYRNVMFTIWDINPNYGIGEVWRTFIDCSMPLIFVVDASELERIEESRQILQLVLADERLNGSNLLVLANKQDKCDVIDTALLAQKLGLNEMKSRKWHIQPTSALTSVGLKDGLGMGLSFSCSSSVPTLLVGLENHGKTTLLYKILNKTEDVVHTTDFNHEDVTYRNLTFHVWDLNGQDKIRPLWHHYCSKSMPVIFVVDATDIDRLEEAREALQIIIGDEKLKDSCLLVVANKQDLPDALETSVLRDTLGLNELKNREWHIQPTSAVTGEGITDALDWLYNHK